MSAQPSATTPTIVPFWNRLREVMLYPAHGGAMASIVLLALGRLLIFLPFVGWILAIMAIVAMYRYAFECLRASADGYLQPPEVGVSVDRSVGRKYIWLMLILLFVAFCGIALLGPVLGLILMLFIGISLPGATMTLAMEESLSSALNPLQWITIFTRVGWPYLAVVGLCLVIALSQAYASMFVVKIVPPFVAVLLIGIISNYALVMTFHLMGYLLYQYHDEIGFVPAAPQLVRPNTPIDPDQSVLDEAGNLVRDGKPEEATELLRRQLRVRGGTPGVHAQFRRLLRVGDNKAELLEHGRTWISILLDQGNEQLALEQLRECQALDPEFVPAGAIQVGRLANKAMQLGQAQVALNLLTASRERFPKNPAMVQNDLLAATLLHERMGQDEQARALLLNLKQAFPNDPSMPEIDAKLAVIERIMAGVKKPAGAQT